MQYIQRFLFIALAIAVSSVSADKGVLAAVRRGDADALVKAAHDAKDLSFERPVGGVLPIVEATKLRKHDIVDLLLQMGASAHGVEPDGDNALLYAFENNMPDTAKALLSHGAKPDEGGEQHKSARQLVEMKGETVSDEMQAILVAYDADGAQAFEDPPGHWLKAYSEEDKLPYYVTVNGGKAVWSTPPSCGWKRSELSGHTLYINTVSGQTVWKRPRALSWKRIHKEGMQFWMNFATNSSQMEVPAELPADMVTELENEPNRFWHNMATGEVSWDDPTGGEWKEIKDDEGHVFWFHPASGERQWEKPAEKAWSEVASEEHDGAVYYHNEVTGEVQWDRPAVLSWYEHTEL